MIIINDFFKRHIEAVSNQMEAVLNAVGGKIITAYRFLGQKPLQEEDIKDNIYVYKPEDLDKEIYREVMTSSDPDIFVFEEEPCEFKVETFNKSGKNVYVAMYRKPYPEYIKHLKRYKNLKKIFVELESHKQILLNAGFSNSQVVVTPTPAKIPLLKNLKEYNPENINLVFASWNNTDEIDTCYHRGLLYVVDCMAKYPNLSLTVVLRDNRTEHFKDYISKRGVDPSRIKLLNVKNSQELINAFDSADYVIYFLQMQIVKDVPNSLIDGMSRGKPILMTDVLSFADYVKENNVGLVFKPKDIARNFKLTPEEYATLSENAFNLARQHTMQNYVNIIRNECGRKKYEMGNNKSLGD